jgi:hypothetical protein
MPTPAELSRAATTRNHVLYQPNAKPGTPVYGSASPPTWVSYSGQDIRVFAQSLGRIYDLGNLYTFSYSTFRDITPVRGLGQAAALGHARGYRTIAGTMVFTLFNKDAFYDMISHTAHDRNASGWWPVLVDQIPAFNLVLIASTEVTREVYAPEYGDTMRKTTLPAGSPTSRLLVYQVTLSSEGSTFSVDDMITEGVYNYHALGVAPLHDAQDLLLAGNPAATAEDGARALQEAKNEVLQKEPLRDTQPKGLTWDDYMASLTGQNVLDLLREAENKPTNARRFGPVYPSPTVPSQPQVEMAPVISIEDLMSATLSNSNFATDSQGFVR